MSHHSPPLDGHVANLEFVRDILYFINKSSIPFIYLRSPPAPGPLPGDLDLLIEESTFFRFVHHISTEFNIFFAQPRPGKYKLQVTRSDCLPIKLDIHFRFIEKDIICYPESTLFEVAKRNEYGYFLPPEFELVLLLLHDIISRSLIQPKNWPRLNELLKRANDDAILHALQAGNITDILYPLLTNISYYCNNSETIPSIRSSLISRLPHLSTRPTCNIDFPKSLLKASPSTTTGSPRLNKKQPVNFSRFLPNWRASPFRYHSSTYHIPRQPPRHDNIFGLFIVFVGPHGSGKSTLIAKITNELNRFKLPVETTRIAPYSKLRRRHFPPRIPRSLGYMIRAVGERPFNVSDSVQIITRSKSLSADDFIDQYPKCFSGPLGPYFKGRWAKKILLTNTVTRLSSYALFVMLTYIFEILLHLFLIFPDQLLKQRAALKAAREGNIVISDRYTDDLQVGSYLSKSNRHSFLRWLINTVSVQPDIRYIVSTNIQDLKNRKDKIPEISSYREVYSTYLNLSDQSNSVFVDTSRPIESCVSGIMNDILTIISKRQAFLNRSP